MRIVHESSDALILKEQAVILRVVGAALGIAGAVMVLVSVMQGTALIGLLIAGIVMTTLGALFALLPATHTFAFSRSERRLVIVRQRLGRVSREEYPLRDVADADVEESTSSDGNTWRVVVRLADGTTIPVTSYYSSGYEGKRQAADRMRGFLVQAGFRDLDAKPVPPAPTVTSAESLTRRQKLTATGFLTAFGLVFGGIGGTIMVREHQRITTWIPVQATVLSKRVDSNSDSDGTTHSPVVVYRYYVNDRPYTSSRVLPMNESRSGGWAHKIIAEYDVNGTYTAWYNPADASEAFLRRARSIVAPIFAGVGALLVVIALFTRRASTRSR